MLRGKGRRGIERGGVLRGKGRRGIERGGVLRGKERYSKMEAVLERVWRVFGSDA